MSLDVRLSPDKIIIGIGFAITLPLVAESKPLSTIGTPPDQTILCGENVQQEEGAKYAYPTPILDCDLKRWYYYHKDCRQRDCHWGNHPILAFGVGNFLSYAAHFCKYEALNGSLEVVSVGSGKGVIENDIITTYAKHFGGEELNITLVDPDPKCRVDFRMVDDLLAERANVVGNCVLFIIWPEGFGASLISETATEGYDIQAIGALQPRAVLTMYEMTGLSGSEAFVDRLSPSGSRQHTGSDESFPSLDNYMVKTIAYQSVVEDPRTRNADNMTWNEKRGSPLYEFRLAKLERTD